MTANFKKVINKALEKTARGQIPKHSVSFEMLQTKLQWNSVWSMAPAIKIQPARLRDCNIRMVANRKYPMGIFPTKCKICRVLLQQFSLPPSLLSLSLSLFLLINHIKLVQETVRDVETRL
jgi:hypothetical protein